MKFELKQEHITLISELNFECVITTDSFQDRFRPGISRKRPFGNSGITHDVMQKLGYVNDKGEYSESNLEKAEMLIIELPVAMEIVVRQKTFEPGVYEVSEYSAYFNYRMARNFQFWNEPLKEIEMQYKDTDQLDSLIHVCSSCCDENPHKVLKQMKWFTQTDFLRYAVGVFEKYAIAHWIEQHDSENYCHYCIHNSDCPHGMVCYGGAPIEPPCCTYDLTELLDTESILEDLENGEEQ